MANKQIDMRKIKQIFKLYSEGVSKRKISPTLARASCSCYNKQSKRGFEIRTYKKSQLPHDRAKRTYEVIFRVVISKN